MSMQRRAIAATRRGRNRASALMIDGCKIERPQGEPVFDPATGKDTQPMVLVYPSEQDTAAGRLGKCQLQRGTTQAAESTTAEHLFTVSEATLKLPIGTPVQPGDIATIIHSELMPENEGQTFRLTDLERKTAATAARWNVELVTT